MITGISIVTVWVLDQDAAKEFYTEKMGFKLTNDVKLEGGMRWLTVRPPGVHLHACAGRCTPGGWRPATRSGSSPSR